MKKNFLAGIHSSVQAAAGDTTIQGASGSISGKVTGLELSDIGNAYVEAWKPDPPRASGPRALQS